MNTTILLDELNPYRNLRATVEADERTVYLYLAPECESPVPPRALWLKNLQKAPEFRDEDAIRSGLAPLCPKTSCRNPDGEAPPVPGDYTLVWSQDGCGAILFFRGEVDAVLPPLWTKKGSFGYSRGVIAPHAGTHPLEDMSELREWAEGERKFWEERKNPDHWNRFRDAMINHYEKYFGKHVKYFAVVDRAYPPLAIALFRPENRCIYATVGMSDQNMPPGFGPSGEYIPRIELICETGSEAEYYPSALGKIASYPWAASRTISPGQIFEGDLPDVNFLFKKTDNKESSFVIENLSLADGGEAHFLEARLLTEREKIELIRESPKTPFGRG